MKYTNHHRQTHPLGYSPIFYGALPKWVRFTLLHPTKYELQLPISAFYVCVFFCVCENVCVPKVRKGYIERGQASNRMRFEWLCAFDGNRTNNNNEWHIRKGGFHGIPRRLHWRLRWRPATHCCPSSHGVWQANSYGRLNIWTFWASEERSVRGRWSP